MAVQVSYPGVYIEEFTPGNPIEGVPTSIAAFIGVAAKGEVNEPVKISSFDRFNALYGEQPVNGFHLWYAVRGFFENGGKICYIVRASNGRNAEGMLTDGSPGANDVIRVIARDPGVPTPAVNIQVASANLLSAANTSVFRPQLTNYTVAGPREVKLPSAQAAAPFRPGDTLNLGGGDTSVVVIRVSGDRIRLATNLTAALNAIGQLRLADAPSGTKTIRIVSTVPIPPDTLIGGTILTIKQGVNTDSQIVDSVQAEPISPALTTYRITFRDGLVIPLSLDPAGAAGTVQSEEFSVKISQGAASNQYANLSIDPGHPRYFAKIINDAPDLVRVELSDPPPAAKMPSNLPLAQTLTLGAGQSGGALGLAEDLSTITSAVYIEALETLREVDEVTIIAIPDASSATDPSGFTAVQQGMIAHCEQLGDRFAVLDALPPVTDQPLFGPNSVETQRPGLDSTRGYAALYYPWLQVPRFPVGPPLLVPPSGHVCGIFARTDNTRGVHKAPANEIVNGAVGVERTMSNEDQGQLNLQGINVIRVFQAGGRPVLWGARTTATDTNWRYVNIRRLFLFLEESIQEGIRFAVFEPNNIGLWEKLKRSITDFLTRVWRDGALFGETADKAFYVRIDETLNPDSSRALGRLYIEIGVRPSYPAEFIIVRIGIWYGGSQVTEA